MRPVVDEEKCIGCGACFEVCPASPKVMEIREIEAKGRNSDSTSGGLRLRRCLRRRLPTKAFQLIKD